MHELYEFLNKEYNNLYDIRSDGIPMNFIGISYCDCDTMTIKYLDDIERYEVNVSPESGQTIFVFYHEEEVILFIKSQFGYFDNDSLNDFSRNMKNLLSKINGFDSPYAERLVLKEKYDELSKNYYTDIKSQLNIKELLKPCNLYIEEPKEAGGVYRCYLDENDNRKEIKIIVYFSGYVFIVAYFENKAYKTYCLATLINNYRNTDDIFETVNNYCNFYKNNKDKLYLV